MVVKNSSKSIIKKMFSIERLISTIALFMSIFHLFCAYYGQPEETIFRTTFVSLIMLLVFLIHPLGGKLWNGKINLLFVVNMFFILFPLIAQYYILYDIHIWYLKFGNPNFVDVIIGSIYILMVLEATRRTSGLPIVIVAIFFLFHARFANLLKLGIFYGPPMPWHIMINFLWIENSGIFGLPIMVTASIVTLFLIFASLLEKQNIVKIIMDMAYALTGYSVGGTAKAAVVGSGFMGMISGSSVANVVTTGSITIPLMKKMGYKPHFAGGVEAAASTGGQIMPPIMGATAFIIAEFIGISYIKLAIYAFIPALLYYMSIFIFIHFTSIHGEIKPVPKSYMPSFIDTLKKGGHILLSIVLLVIFLIKGYSIQTTVFIVIITTFILSFLKPITRLTPKSFLEALVEAPRKFISVGMVCATAGIIVGSISVSGLSWRMASSLLTFSGGNLLLSLLLAMVICIILGMGMTTTPVYLVVAAVIIPTLIKLGVPVVSAHLFAFYFGVLSSVTPPVAVASFAAASVANSDFAKTSLVALKLAITGFIIPFIFCYYPSLLLTYGSNTLMVFLCTVIALVCLTSGLSGYLLRKLNFLERIIIGLLPIFLLFYLDVTEPVFAFFMIAVFGAIIVLQKFLPYIGKIDEIFIYKNFKKHDEIKKSTLHKTDLVINVDKKKLNFDEKDQKYSLLRKETFIGWGIWAIILLILIVLGNMHFMIKYYNYFLLILFIISYFGKVLLDTYIR